MGRCRWKSFSNFAFTTASILVSGGQGRLKASPMIFFVASMPSLLPLAISLVAWSSTSDGPLVKILSRCGSVLAHRRKRKSTSSVPVPAGGCGRPVCGQQPRRRDRGLVRSQQSDARQQRQPGFIVMMKSFTQLYDFGSGVAWQQCLGFINLQKFFARAGVGFARNQSCSFIMNGNGCERLGPVRVGPPVPRSTVDYDT